MTITIHARTVHFTASLLLVVLCTYSFIGIVAAQVAGSHIKLEAESGSFSGLATAVNDSSASNGMHLNFTQPAPPPTPPLTGVLFYEDFIIESDMNNIIGQGSDGVSTTNNPTADSNGHQAVTFHADHDLACGSPATYRTITESNAWPTHSFWCPNATGHFMTGMNTTSYVSLGFTPRGLNNKAKIFPDSASKVCIDVNTTGLGNRRWWDIAVVSEARYLANSYPTNVSGLLGGAITNEPVFFYIDPDHAVPGLAVGYDAEFHFVDHEGARLVASNGSWVYQNHDVVDRFNTDKATRFKVCLKNNGDGTVTHTKARADGTTMTTVMTNSSFPRGNKVFIVMDKSYNPDKAENPSAVVDGYTWHWDNFTIE